MYTLNTWSDMNRQEIRQLTLLIQVKLFNYQENILIIDMYELKKNSYFTSNLTWKLNISQLGLEVISQKTNK